jgi:hypothetical protein
MLLRNLPISICAHMCTIRQTTSRLKLCMTRRLVVCVLSPQPCVNIHTYTCTNTYTHTCSHVHAHPTHIRTQTLCPHARTCIPTNVIVITPSMWCGLALKSAFATMYTTPTTDMIVPIIYITVCTQCTHQCQCLLPVCIASVLSHSCLTPTQRHYPTCTHKCV